MIDEVLIEYRTNAAGKQWAWITLNRPRALNALNHAMILSILEHLAVWRVDENVVGVIMTSTDTRAFCAGGDVRAVYEWVAAGEHGKAAQFFTDEYAMNQALFHFPKPIVALLDGIVMGGGAGVSMHGSHPIATENMRFAMPEARIGFYPDVGMSYHLARLPGQLGLYLGLTGNSVGAAICQHVGLVKAVLLRARLDAFIARLLDNNAVTREAVCAVIEGLLAEMAETPIAAGADADTDVDVEDAAADDDVDADWQDADKRELGRIHGVANCFLQVERAAMQACLQEHAEVAAKWRHACAQQLNYNAPSSLRMTRKVLCESAALSFDEVIARDRTLSHALLKQHDFMEGVRALLIEKDKQPAWRD